MSLQSLQTPCLDIVDRCQKLFFLDAMSREDDFEFADDSGSCGRVEFVQLKKMAIIVFCNHAFFVVPGKEV